MKKLIFIFSLLFGFTGCYDTSTVVKEHDSPTNEIIMHTSDGRAIRHYVYDYVHNGHKYIIFTRVDNTFVIHDPDCDCFKKSSN